MQSNRYPEFLTILEAEDKQQAVVYVLQLLEKQEITLSELYFELLTPAMYDIKCVDKSDRVCIWKEHLRSSIASTILGAVYPYVLAQQAPKNGKKIVIACPDEEYHELGALIVSHLFTLQGFDCHYLGANTPIEQILSAVELTQADYLAISVTNYYNMVVTKELIEQAQVGYPWVKIIVGGQAFLHQEAQQSLFHHYYLKNEEDILQFSKEVAHETGTTNRP